MFFELERIQFFERLRNQCKFFHKELIQYNFHLCMIVSWKLRVEHMKLKEQHIKVEHMKLKEQHIKVGHMKLKGQHIKVGHMKLKGHIGKMSEDNKTANNKPATNNYVP